MNRFESRVIPISGIRAWLFSITPACCISVLARPGFQTAHSFSSVYRLHALVHALAAQPFMSDALSLLRSAPFCSHSTACWDILQACVENEVKIHALIQLRGEGYAYGEIIYAALCIAICHWSEPLVLLRGGVELLVERLCLDGAACVLKKPVMRSLYIVLWRCVEMKP